MTDRLRHRPAVQIPEADQVNAATPTEHSHPRPRAVVWAAAALIVMTLLGLLLLSAYAYTITARLATVERVIDSRTADRDEQTAQLREDIRTAVCDVLDELPGRPELDPVRAAYGCAPSTPQEDTP